MNYRQPGRGVVASMPGAFLYVVEFTNGLIKVGRATSPRDRVGAHRAEGRRHGNPPVRQWVSVLITEPLLAEDELVKFCKRQPGATVTGAEWFHGLAMADVVAEAARVVDQYVLLDYEDWRPGVALVDRVGALTELPA